MAWNPSPEVRVARDAATQMQLVLREHVDRMIVIYTTTEGHWGYASYGDTPTNCRAAKVLADVAAQAVLSELETE